MIHAIAIFIQSHPVRYRLLVAIYVGANVNRHTLTIGSDDHSWRDILLIASDIRTDIIVAC